MGPPVLAVFCFDETIMAANEHRRDDNVTFIVLKAKEFGQNRKKFSSDIVVYGLMVGQAAATISKTPNSHYLI